MNRLVLGGLCALLLQACATADPASTPTQDTQGTVTWIIDGDSLRVDVENEELEVRLLGINAPEQGECFHEEATRFLIDTVKGKEVTLSISSIDQFGRTLAYLSEGSRLVNEVTVARGFAIATTPDEGDEIGNRILGAEEDAYRLGEGLWSEESCATGPIPDVIIATDDSNPAPPGSPESETIVVRNTGNEVVALGGWTLRDESSRHRFSFSANIELDPGEAFSIRSSDPGWEPGGGTVWNNSGDLVLLLDADGRVVDRWRY